MIGNVNLNLFFKIKSERNVRLLQIDPKPKEEQVHALEIRTSSMHTKTYIRISKAYLSIC